MKHFNIILILATIIAFSACSDDDVDPETIADFEANNTQPDAYEEVTFSVDSDDNIEEWHWEFEGAQTETSDEAEPVVYWKEGGSYRVSLTVKSSDGEEYETSRSDFINVVPAVEKKNQSLVNKVTSTSCTFCGTWGWQVFEDLIESYSDEAVMMGTYINRGTPYDELYERVSVSMRNAITEQRSTPTFVVNGNLIEGFSNIDEIYDKYENFHNEHLNAPVKVSSAINADINGNSIAIEAKTRFFQDLEGEYKLGIYVLEHEVPEVQAYITQAGEGALDPERLHKYVLRAEAGDDELGRELINGSVAEGETFVENIDLEVDSDWNIDNLHFAAIIWEVNGNDHSVVNASW